MIQKSFLCPKRTLCSVLLLALLAAGLALPLVPAPAQATDIRYAKPLLHISIREQAAPKSKIVANINLSEPLEVLKEVGDWVQVIQDRFLPDKAIDLLDEAGSKMNLTLNFVDPKVIDQRLIEAENLKAQATRDEDFEKAAYFRDQIAKYKELQQTSVLDKDTPIISEKTIEHIVEQSATSKRVGSSLFPAPMLLTIGIFLRTASMTRPILPDTVSMASTI